MQTVIRWSSNGNCVDFSNDSGYFCFQTIQWHSNEPLSYYNWRQYTTTMVHRPLFSPFYISSYIVLEISKHMHWADWVTQCECLGLFKDNTRGHLTIDRHTLAVAGKWTSVTGLSISRMPALNGAWPTITENKSQLRLLICSSLCLAAYSESVLRHD